MGIDGTQLRARARHHHAKSRELAFTGPDGAGAVGIPLAPLLREVFALLAPDRPQATTSTWVAGHSYNWGRDRAYLTAEGDGLLLADHCFGALPGDGVDTIYHLLVGDDVVIVVEVGHDYAQSMLQFKLAATPEVFDVANDVLLQVATARGLALA